MACWNIRSLQQALKRADRKLPPCGSLAKSSLSGHASPNLTIAPGAIGDNGIVAWAKDAQEGKFSATRPFSGPSRSRPSSTRQNGGYSPQAETEVVDADANADAWPPPAAKSFKIDTNCAC